MEARDSPQEDRGLTTPALSWLLGFRKGYFLELRGVLPGDAQGLRVHIHDQRRAGADRPTAGAFGWARLTNLFYWIERKNGFGGMWATRILPFADPVSFPAYMDRETAVYDQAA